MLHLELVGVGYMDLLNHVTLSAVVFLEQSECIDKSHEKYIQNMLTTKIF